MGARDADRTSGGDLTSIRSMLFVPASRPDLFANAASSGADMVLIDLEDSVADEAGAEARLNLAEFLDTESDRGRALAVRTHGVRTPAFAPDLEVVVHTDVALLVLPKVEDPDDLMVAADSLSRAESSRSGRVGRIRLMPLLESALAIHRGYEILSAVGRIVGTGFAGAEDGDLMNDLGAAWNGDGTSMLHARSEVLLVSRAADLEMVLDGVWGRLDDDLGFERDTVRGSELGYTGRLIVHPSQVEVVNRVYTPSGDAIRSSIRLVAAAREHRRAGVGAFKYGGRLIDRPMVARARRLVDRAQRLGLVGEDDV